MEENRVGHTGFQMRILSPFVWTKTAAISNVISYKKYQFFLNIF